MSDILSLIRKPVEKELADFIANFEHSLITDSEILKRVLDHVTKRGGKRMRPLLTLLMAKALGNSVSPKLIYSATALELLHTASLVHDDVVDESMERRGQSSVNASFDNKVAVLSGDFILSTALCEVAKSTNNDIITILARLGKLLSEGELRQIDYIQDMDITEEKYFRIIGQKTASLFEACCSIAAIDAGKKGDDFEKASEFGYNIGLIFQIRDDIFDYLSDAKVIGKPVGNDMKEGKLTLPVIHAYLSNKQNSRVGDLVRKVKALKATDDDIHELVTFTIGNGGIEYAQGVMDEYCDKCVEYINTYVADEEIRTALQNYVKFVVGREK